MPATDDERGLATFQLRDPDAVQCDGDGLQHGCLRERECIGQLVEDAGGHGDVLREGACAPVVGARNTDYLAIVADIDLAPETELAGSAVDGRVEGHAIAYSKPLYLGTHRCESAGGLVAHHDRWNAASGRTVVSVHIAAADAACCHLHQHIQGTWLRHRQIGDLKVLIF